MSNMFPSNSNMPDFSVPKSEDYSDNAYHDPNSECLSSDPSSTEVIDHGRMADDEKSLQDIYNEFTQELPSFEINRLELIRKLDSELKYLEVIMHEHEAGMREIYNYYSGNMQHLKTDDFRYKQFIFHMENYKSQKSKYNAKLSKILELDPSYITRTYPTTI